MDAGDGAGGTIATPIADPPPKRPRRRLFVGLIAGAVVLAAGIAAVFLIPPVSSSPTAAPESASAGTTPVDVGDLAGLQALVLGEVDLVRPFRQQDAAVPDDFQAALDASAPASAFFATLTGSTRFAFLFRISNLKRPETRARRIAEYVALLEQGQTLR